MTQPHNNPTSAACAQSANHVHPHDILKNGNVAHSNGDSPPLLTKPHKSKLKARRLRARIANHANNNSGNNGYSEHLRKTRDHNQNFKKMTQKLKQMARNETCPSLNPLTPQEKQLIVNSVKRKDSCNLALSDNLGQEIDDGNTEYKWKLIAPAPDRMQHLITQMMYRLGEGRGECIYQIGIEDCGHPRGLDDVELIESISTIYLMAKQLNAFICITSIKQGMEGKVATLKITKSESLLRRQRKVEDEQKKYLLNNHDIRVCVAGNESVGKSTLIGVLTRGKLDDGNGYARMNVFRHRHEIFDGRTSAISHHILGFDDNGIITNYKAFHLSEWNEIVKSSTKLITFVDHPGHERYFKTSVFGLTAHKPHYVLFTVSLDEFDGKPADSHKRDRSEKEQEWSQMLSLNLNGLLDCNSSSDDDDDETDGDTESEDSENRRHRSRRGDEEGDDDSNHEKDNDAVKLPHSTAESVMAQKSNDPSSDYHKYLTMCESINVPLFIVITKADIDKNYGYERLPKMLDKISTVIREKSHGKLKIKLIETSSEASRAARALSSSVISYIPIIVTSCVNGEGLEILKTFLFSLPSNKLDLNANTTLNPTVNTHDVRPTDNKCDEEESQKVEFGVDEIYDVNDVGIVVGGVVRHGTIHINDVLSIGPDKEGNYRQVTIQSIHVRRKDCSYAFEGQMASLLLAEIESKEELRRGMVIVDDTKCNVYKRTCYSFEAHIDVLSNCTLRENSQPIIHIENIRQSAHILHLHTTDHVLKHGENGCGVFTFLHHPEFIRCGMKIIIRKSHGPIAIGRVIKLLDSPDKPLVPLNSLQKPLRLRTSKHKTDFKHYLRKWNLENNHAKKCKHDSSNDEANEDLAATSDHATEKEMFSTSEDEEVDSQVVASYNKDSEQNQSQQLNQCPIRNSGDAGDDDTVPIEPAMHSQCSSHDRRCRRRRNRGRGRSKKKKQFVLVWRSGLGFEHFYPTI